MRWSLLVLLVACSPPTAPPPLADAAPTPPAAGSPPCVQACAAMAAVGCQEGASAYCAGAMTRVEGAHLIVGTGLDGGAAFVTCSLCATATTPGEVGQRCGSSCTGAGAER